jgi:hypothetical protein
MSIVNVNFNMILSVIIILFLLFMIVNHIFKRLNWNIISLEGFETPDEPTAEPKVEESKAEETKSTVEETKVAEPKVEETNVEETKSTVEETKVAEPKVEETKVEESKPSVDDASETDKSTTMTDLFESVNKQMDIIRTIKLSENMIPIKIDKTVPETKIILANLKLLINNGVYKNELDLKEVYDKYIGNKAVQLLASDINSLKMESLENVSALETTYLTRTKSVVDGHQKIIDKILDNKSKQ